MIWCLENIARSFMPCRKWYPTSVHDPCSCVGWHFGDHWKLLLNFVDVRLFVHVCLCVCMRACVCVCMLLTYLDLGKSEAPLYTYFVYVKISQSCIWLYVHINVFVCVRAYAYVFFVFRQDNDSDSDFEETKGVTKKRKRKDDGPVSIYTVCLCFDTVSLHYPHCQMLLVCWECFQLMIPVFALSSLWPVRINIMLIMIIIVITMQIQIIIYPNSCEQYEDVVLWCIYLYQFFSYFIIIHTYYIRLDLFEQ